MALLERSDWSLAETYAWIAFRSEAEVAAAPLKSIGGYIQLRGYPAPHRDLPRPLLSAAQAENELSSGFASGKLRAWGVRDGIREQLPTHSWTRRALHFHSSCVVDEESGETWSDVVVCAADALELWRGTASDSAAAEQPQKRRRGPAPGQETEKRKVAVRGLELLASGNFTGRDKFVEIGKVLCKEFPQYAPGTIAKYVRDQHRLGEKKLAATTRPATDK